MVGEPQPNGYTEKDGVVEFDFEKALAKKYFLLKLPRFYIRLSARMNS